MFLVVVINLTHCYNIPWATWLNHIAWPKIFYFSLFCSCLYLISTMDLFEIVFIFVLLLQFYWFLFDFTARVPTAHPSFLCHHKYPGTYLTLAAYFICKQTVMCFMTLSMSVSSVFQPSCVSCHLCFTLDEGNSH